MTKAFALNASVSSPSVGVAKYGDPNMESNEQLSMDEIDVDELDDYLELFQQDELIREALDNQVDLCQYAKHIDKELRSAEMDSVSQFVMKSSDIVQLHDQVQECDDMLARMQEVLLGFQADLGGISDEIRHLQEGSVYMNMQLKNRRDTENQIKIYLDRVAMTPTFVKAIDEAEINEAYVEQLMILHEKLVYAKQNAESKASEQQSVALKETEPYLQKLLMRSVARIRDFLYLKMNELRKPKTNVQMLQQNTLLPVKYLITFLMYHGPQVEEEFRHLYAETLSKILANVFKLYHSGLMKFYEEIATKNDLIVVEEQSLKGLFTNKVNLTKRSDAFSLGDREKIMDNLAAAPLILHVAQAEHQQLPYEAVFRNIQQHLMNSATTEYLFIIDFFRGARRDEDVSRSRDLFLQIYAKTLSICLENLENYLFNCHDAFALLLMILLNHTHRLTMEKRCIPCLDSYFDRITLLLWPRFKQVFDMNLMSVKNAKVKKLGTIDLHPHYVVRRYAEFAASLLKLSLGTQNPVVHIKSACTDPKKESDSSKLSMLHMQLKENGVGEMLLKDLAMLREEMLQLLVRISEHHKSSKEKCVFFINNYDLILSLFKDRHIVSEETLKFEELLAQQREYFVEEELRSCYGKLIAFVKSNESVIVSPGKNTSVINSTTAGIRKDIDAQIERIVQEFNATWKVGIETINASVLRYFSNFRNGMEILKLVLTQLLLYYTRFTEIAKKTWTRPPSYSNELVTTQDILYEIKKYSRSF